MSKILKYVFVHLTGAIIVGLIGYLIFTRGLLLITSIPDEALNGFFKESHAEFVVLILSGFLLYYVVRLPDDVLRYIWFLLFTKERKACGLFVEGYFKRKNSKSVPVISLIVVYFDVRAEELKICGHSFDQSKEDKTKFNHHASWESRAVHFEPKKEHFEIFYIHQGDIVGRESDVRGTTTVRLPMSTNTVREGFFCDLSPVEPEPQSVSKHKDVTHFEATHFEIIRAPNELKNIFYSKIEGRLARLTYRLKLSCPRERAFCEFVDDKGRDLVKADGADIMTRVWKQLEVQIP